MTALTPRTIAYYTDSAGFGGAEEALLWLLAGLDRRVWRPVLLVHEPAISGRLSGRARALDVPVIGLAFEHGLMTGGFTLRLVAQLREWRTGLFHAHLNWPLACRYGLLAAALARVPSIATVQLWAPFSRGRAYLLQHLVSCSADAFVAVSGDIAMRLRRELHVPQAKIRLIPNGTPLASEGHATKRARATCRPFTILTVARLHAQKGHCYLLEAVARVPEVRLICAGEGPEESRLREYARRLGVDDRVDFLGYRTDVPELLESCDLFVLPSLFEGLPISVLEAMAMGKPVIGTAVGGTLEVIRNGSTGLLVPPADSAALADAIRTLTADRALCWRLGAAGRARVRAEFSEEAVVHRTVALYEELLARSLP